MIEKDSLLKLLHPKTPKTLNKFYRGCERIVGKKPLGNKMPLEPTKEDYIQYPGLQPSLGKEAKRIRNQDHPSPKFRY
jgi:hypothetical protein